MDLSLARSLAKADELSLPMQRYLWSIGDEWVKCSIAEHALLDEGIKTEILLGKNQHVLASWAQKGTRGTKDLAAATKVATDEQTLAVLVNQPFLDEPTLALLGKKVNDHSAMRLMDREDLPPRVRESLVPAFLRSVGESSGSVGRITRARAGTEKSVWLKVLEGVEWVHVSLLTALPYKDDPACQEAFVKVCERLDPKDSAFSERRQRELERAVSEQISSVTLPERLVLRLKASSMVNVPDAVGKIDERLRCDTATLMQGLTCTPSRICEDAGHVMSLRLLSQQQSVVNWSESRLPMEALLHAEDLSPSVTSSILGKLYGPRSRSIADEIADAGLEDPRMLKAMCTLIEQSGAYCIRDTPGVEPALLNLARKGWDGLLRSQNVRPGHHELVVNEFTPAFMLLTDTTYTSMLLDTIARLAPKEQEAALALLKEWVGSLTGLCASVKRM